MKRIPVLLLVICLIAFLFSCNNEVPQVTNSYSTPTIVGKVSLPTDSGVSSSAIYIQVAETGNQYRTNEDGSFVISGLSEGEEYTLYFSSNPFSSVVARSIATRDNGNDNNGNGNPGNNGNGHAYGAKKDKVKGEKGEGCNIGEIPLKKLGSVKGTVLLSNSDDHLGIDVFIPGTSYMAKTNSEGSFTITDVPEGIYTVAFMKDDYSTVLRNNIRLIINEEEDESFVVVDTVTLTKASASIIGNLSFEGYKGEELPIATITATNESDASINNTTTSDTKGQFTVPDLKDGMYTLQIVPTNDSRFQPLTLKSIEIASPLNTNIGTVQVPSFGGNLEGTISLSSSSEKGNITVLIESDSYRYSTVTNAEGYFTISNIIPDNYRVSIMKTGYQSSLQDISITSGETVTLDQITLKAAYGYITGKVFLSGEEKSSGVAVTAKSTNLDEVKSYVAYTEEDGTFSIRVDVGAQYTITASASGFLTSPVTLVDVTLGLSSDIGNIALKRNQGALKGTITLENAPSHEGITLLLRNDSSSYSSSTDQDGSFTFSSITPGTYSLLASKSGYVSKGAESIAISADNTTELSENIVLPIGVRNITGNVSLELSSYHAGVTITATSLEDNTRIYSALSNSEGSFSLAGMIPGEYMITLSHIGYKTITLETINVIDNTYKSLGNIALEIDRGIVRGSVKLEGRTDHSGTEVELVGTNYTAKTDKDGLWEMSVPSANYPAGVIYRHDDFDTMTVADTITVLTNGAYGVNEVELKAVAITVLGKIEVAATPDASGVRVSLENTSYYMVTESDGTFRFDHVPLGDYNLIVDRDNTPRATEKFTATACPYLDLETIRIIPNSANISGRAYLDGMDSHKDILVTVTTEGEDAVLTTTTDNTGYYYVGNLISTGTHHVVFSKTGWDDSADFEVSGLEPLENRSLGDVTLKDNTAPVINSVIINSGANTAVDKNVTITINAEDFGSGVDKLNIYAIEDGEDAPNLDNVDDDVFVSQISEYQLPSGNGTKRVYVRVIDKSGNKSEEKIATVTLVNQKTEVSGILSSDNLIWTEEYSPYYVTGSIVVNAGDTLLIKPGVDVQFAGPYSIRVEGTIEAIGTEEKKISFYGVKEGEGTWKGINGVSDNISYSGSVYCPEYSNGNVLSNVSMDGGSVGVIGNLFVEKSIINADTPLKNFRGVITSSNIIGNTSQVDKGVFVNNQVNLNSLRFGDHGVNWYDYYILGNNFIVEDILFVCWVTNIINIENNCFEGETLRTDLYTRYRYLECHNNDFIGYEKIEIGNELNENNPAIISNNNFDTNDLIISRGSNGYIFFNNLSGITTTISRSDVKELDCTYNYWGKTNTLELERVGNNNNISFISDYFDSDFDYSRVVYDNWLKSKNESAGYKGDGYIAYEAEWISSSFARVDSNYSITVLDEIQISLNSLNGKEITQYRYALDINSLFEAAWSNVATDSIISISISNEEAAKILDNKGLFIQVKDSDGNISGISKVEITSGGLIGPAGGFIFYDKGDNTDGWRYLEAAPSDAGSYVFGYYRPDGTTDTLVGTSTEIGTGKENTEKLIDAMDLGGYAYSSNWNNSTAEYAAKVCSDYSDGGDDWFLPSLDELRLMYQNLHQAGLGGFSSSGYWSSSEGNENYAWFISFDNGFESSGHIRDGINYIRPARAF